MKRITLAILAMGVSTGVFAGDAQNIQACVKQAKGFAGVTLNEFDASYESNVLSMSTAKWKNAYCEVKLSGVYNLQVNGQQYIYNGYAGKDSYILNSQLDEKTDVAINKLRSRIALLQQRASQVSVSLKLPNPNHAWLTKYVDEGIEKSLGAQCPAPGPTATPVQGTP